MNERRRFNQHERIDLFLAADGFCEVCGKPLASGWHADHVRPYSKGGATDVSNGQALCAECNLKKGNSMKTIPPWPALIKLRKCQERAYEKYVALNKVDFLADLTPGAGKTFFAGKVAHTGLTTGKYDFVIIAVPTALLKEQWAAKMSELGIIIQPRYEAGNPISSGYHGIAITYADLLNKAGLLRMWCERYPTLVIMDEPHHLCGEKSWGNAAIRAFELAKARLLITGTAWRSDNERIPFVDYSSGQGEADYVYDYKDAIRDGVCRYVDFPTYDGQTEWVESQTGKIVSASFADEIAQTQMSRRVLTALDPGGNWLSQVICDAHQKLLQCREQGHPDAGGLIVCHSEEHAQKVAQLMRRVIHVTPLVVTSQSLDAKKDIETFKTSSQEWLLAIKIVTEGVDIPRLRVGIYATNVITVLFFRQFVGRFVRWVPGLPEQTAHIYIYEDPRVVAMAYNIAQEVRHVLEEPTPPNDDDGKDYTDPYLLGPRAPITWAPISSEAEHTGAIVETDKIPAAELDAVRSLASAAGLPEERAAHFLRMWIENGHAASAAAPVATEEPHHKQVETLRGKVHGLCSRYANMTGMDYKDVHNMWLRRGGKPQNEADLNDLKLKWEWIKQLIAAEVKRRGN